MERDLEALEKKFILDENIEHENIEDLVSRVLNFCKIDKNGYVLIDHKIMKKISMPDKIMLILSARHLASKLQQKLGKEVTIKEELSSQELSNMLKEKQAVINARLKELKDNKQILPVSRGIYKVAPYAIDSFLETLKGEKE